MKNTIPIKNIYYMLSYAFQILQTTEFKKMKIEEFENTEELFSEILILGIKHLLKNNFNRDYEEKTDSLDCLRGKINIKDSINSLSFLNRKIVCDFDEYTINSKLNQIIKSTVYFLLKKGVDKVRERKLRKLMLYFNSVNFIDLNKVDWKIHFTRNSQIYRLLIGICYLIFTGNIQTNDAGQYVLMDFRDSKLMSALYEKFILEYYKKHFPKYRPSSKVIEWQLDDSNDYLLPRMKTDIMLNQGNKYLIIDAKYYHSSIQRQFNHDTAISNHLYQIFSYVKNKDAELKNLTHEVSGVLLYAKTSNELQPKSDYIMSGNKISIDYLDLDCDFEQIKNKLNYLIKKFFN